VFLGAIVAAVLVTPGVAAADNAPPVITVPGTQTTSEDTSKVFSAGNGNLISVADPDADPDQIHVTLSVSNANLTLNPAATGGLGGLSGDGSGSVQIDGTQSAINAALNGMTFSPTSNFHGATTITADADDQGHNGAGGALTDEKTVTVTVSSVNDAAPVNTVPSGIGTYTGVAKVLSLANLNAIQVSDVDDSDATMDVTLTATHGTVSLGSLTGLTVTAGASGTTTMTVEGLKSAINGRLNGSSGGDTGMTFTPDAGFTGAASVTVTSNDLDPGGAQMDIDAIAVQVDAPGETVFWSASKNTLGGTPGAIAHAALDGSGGWNLLTGPEIQDIPVGIAIDVVGGRIYWSITPTSTGRASIYSAKLDGTDKRLFIDSTTVPSPAVLPSTGDLAIDPMTRRIYWAAGSPIPSATKTISWASLDTPTTGGAVITKTDSTIGVPRGIALDLANQRVYWSSSSLTQGLFFVPLSGGTRTQFSITGATANQAAGLAVDPAASKLYWTNGSGDTAATRLKVADLKAPGAADEASITGTSLSIAPLAGGGLRTVALDTSANRLYFANTAGPKIEYANIDGTGGGADLATGSAYLTSPDGVTVLRKPQATAVPAITGTAAIGSELTCGTATWAADAPNASLYRMPASQAFGAWTRNGATIASATGTTYTPTESGDYRCTRTATNFAGTTTSQSDVVTVAAPATPPTDTTSTTPTTATPAATPASLTLGATGATISTAGVVAVPASCSGAACSGTLSLVTTTAMTGRATVPAGTTIGTAAIALAAGQTGAIAVELNETGRKLARRHASIPASAVIALTGQTSTLTPLALAATRAPAVTPRSADAKVKKGRASAKYFCAAPAGSTCSTTITLTAKIARRTRTIAAATKTLRGGRATKVSFALSTRARAQIADGALHATQRAVSTVPVGLATTKTAKLRLIG